MQISSEMKELESMSKKSKEKLATKVQKACRTRWLSLDKFVESVCRNLPALLQTLRWYQNKDSNPTAIDLLKKLKKPDFIGVLYILKGVLPVLSTLSFFRNYPAIKASQGVKLIFFSDSHLAPKFLKVVANSRKVGRHFQRQTKPLFYAVIVLEIK